MKIAILSMQRVVNFGSVLQAYSLREIIEEITGQRARFIDIEEEHVCFSRKTNSVEINTARVKRLSRAFFSRARRWIMARLSSWNKKKIRRFMRETLNLQEADNDREYDVVVVGSDEVFNHRKGVNFQLHGDVRQAKHVISYAASCGSAALEDVSADDLELVREAMKRFSAVSVRDNATQEYAQALYNGSVQHHLDPVLVGNLGRRKHHRVPIRKYLVVYAYGQRIRTEEEIDAIQKYARENGLKTVAIGGTQTWCDLFIPMSPFRVLDYFYHADAVVTDTFHGAIFSVINRKRFAVITRNTNQNKIRGLLDDLGLGDREVQQMDQLKRILDEPINYEAVDSILERESERTREYLRTEMMRWQDAD